MNAVILVRVKAPVYEGCIPAGQWFGRSKMRISRNMTAYNIQVGTPPLRRKFKRFDQLCAVFGLSVFMQANAFAASPVNSEAQTQDAQNNCVTLTKLNLEAAPGGPAIITSASLIDVPAAGLQYPGFIPSGYGDVSVGAARIHQYCNVTGYVAPQNKFALKLPLPADWNQKFFFYACGGFCGTVSSDAINLGLARGYASVTGNGGHDSAPPFDGVWAANARELQDDFGWRSNHVVALVAKAITTQYYGRPIVRSYMVGNSKGGQAVLMEAQRFPGDFDGLMPSAPVYDYTGRNVLTGAWIAQSISDGHGGSVLNAKAAQAVHKSVLQHCGAQAGVEEELVTDPLSCGWQPDMAACTQDHADSECLSKEQVVAIKRLMSPVTNSRGAVLAAPTFLPGTETEWLGWNYLGSVRPGYSPRIINLELTGQYLKYLVDEKIRDNADALKFNFDADPRTLSRARRVYDATSYDLRNFKARNGKILMWHGWADGAIMATSSIAYYEGVVKVMGGIEKTRDFFRLFLVPGVHHGGGGPGFTGFDSFSALEDWVERGTPPDKLLASKLSNGIVERTRPIYPYPILARYSGKGDPNQEASFVPFTPPSH
jgi:feruloyl esterase